MVWAPDSVEVGLNLGVAQLKDTWKPDDTQRRAAWELYVELVTRIAVVPLAGTEGLLREALSSLYALFAITREVLRRVWTAGRDADAGQRVQPRADRRRGAQ
jgi:hypothetical protein